MAIVLPLRNTIRHVMSGMWKPIAPSWRVVVPELWVGNSTGVTLNAPHSLRCRSQSDVWLPGSGLLMIHYPTKSSRNVCSTIVKPISVYENMPPMGANGMGKK